MLTFKQCYQRTKGKSTEELCRAYEKLLYQTEWDESVLGEEPHYWKRDLLDDNEIIEKLFPSFITLRANMLDALMCHLGEKVYEKTWRWHLNEIRRGW